MARGREEGGGQKAGISTSDSTLPNSCDYSVDIVLRSVWGQAWDPTSPGPYPNESINAGINGTLVGDAKENTQG